MSAPYPKGKQGQQSKGRSNFTRGTFKQTADSENWRNQSQGNSSSSQGNSSSAQNSNSKPIRFPSISLSNNPSLFDNRQTVRNPDEINLQSQKCPDSDAFTWTNNGVPLPGYDSLEGGSKGGKNIRRKSKRITRSRKNKKRRHTRRNNSKRK